MRVLDAVRFVLGAVALLRPRRVAAWWGADPDSGATVWAVRVLGARHLVQAVTSTVHPTRGARVLGSIVDLVHAASMLGVAVVSSRLRRPAMTGASIAFVCAAGALHHATGAAARESPPRDRNVPAHRHTGLCAHPTTASGTVRQAPSRLDLAASRPIDLRDRTAGGKVAGRPESRALTRALIREKERNAHRRAGWLTRRSDRLEDAFMRQPSPPWSPAAAGVLLLVGVWLVVGQWMLVYQFTIHGQNNALRDTGFAIVVSLAGLRLLVARRSTPATGIAVVCGVLLVCAGLWASHSTARAQVNELVCGALVLVCAVATLVDRSAGNPMTAFT